MLADQLIRENPEILSIAELDKLDRVVFMTPYARQTELGCFNLSHTLSLPTKADATSVAIIAHSPLFASAQFPTISFLAAGTRTTGRFWLLLTVRADFQELARLRQHGIKATLYNGANQRLLGPETAQLNRAGALGKDQPRSLSRFIRSLVVRRPSGTSRISRYIYKTSHIA